MTAVRPPRREVPPAGQVTAAALCLLLAGGVAAWALLSLAPPPASPADAPPASFSATRAHRHVAALASAPRPVGSAGNRDAHDYLVDRLRALGLEPETQETTWVIERRGAATAARVRNVVVRIPGNGQGERAVALMAHYDSRPHTPGAGDDASGVAVLLETLRALSHHPPLANDLIALFTDGEETGLLGARAFVAEHAWRDEIAVVLNFEARGNRGPVVMFETRAGDLPLVRRLATVPLVTANSIAAEVYRRMPNDTDFTPFREAGVAGLNFAFVEGFHAYHGALDSADRLSLESLQQSGSQALALALELGDADLEQVGAPEGEAADGVFFTPWRGRLVVYPAAWALPLAAGGTLLLVPLLWRGWRDAWLRRAGVAGGAAAFLVTLVVVPLAAQAAWAALTALRPDLVLAPYGFPYATLGVTLGLGAIALAVGLFTWGLAARWVDPLEAMAGGAVVWALLALLLAAAVPGASYLALWPLLGIEAALALFLALPRHRADPWHAMALFTLGAVPALLLLTPVARLLIHSMTFELAALPGLFLALALGALALPAAAAGRRPLLPAALLLAGVAGAAVVPAVVGAETPRTESVAYLLDSDRQEAWWASSDDRLGPLGRALLGAPPRAELPAMLGGREGWLAVAPTLPLAPPRARVDTSGERVVLHLSSPRRAPVLHLELDERADARIVEIAGRPLAEDGEVRRLFFFGPPNDGVEVVLERTGDGPVEAVVADHTWRLPAAEGVPETLPAGVVTHPSWWASSTLVQWTLRL